MEDLPVDQDRAGNTAGSDQQIDGIVEVSPPPYGCPSGCIGSVVDVGRPVELLFGLRRRLIGDA